MYFNILKKDLKRKKAMNIVLLLFAILASMFVSSGLSNVITISNGTDYFLDKAEIGDYIVITQNGDGGVAELLDKSQYVKSYKCENCYWLQRNEITVNGKEISSKNGTSLLIPYNGSGIHFFNTDNQELSGVKEGEIYVSSGFLKKNDSNVGDELVIDIQGIIKTYVIAGEIKDALFGSSMMGNTRFIINEKEFKTYTDENKLVPYSGTVFYIDSDNLKGLISEISEAKNILFTGDRSMIKMCYVMEMIIAMIVLVLSVVLCIVSFVLLKFVITFTINEETREIGVMKAIGIRNFKIRSLYIVKYFAMALVGGIIGFILGIPFGNMLLRSVSKIMVLGQDMGLLFNVLGAMAVIVIMILFAYRCTSGIKKYTPVDAIRDGQKGERFGKKSKLSIKKTKLSNAFFMAANDVLSAPKRFLTIILSFTICSVFVFGIVLVVDTMKSDSLIGTFGKKSDVYINDGELISINMLSSEGDDMLEKKLKSIENDMQQMGYPADVSIEVWYKYTVSFGGETTTCTFQQNKKTKTTEYDYLEGSAPQNADEIALTYQVAKVLGTKIGDVVTVDFGTEKRDCIVSAYFQTMNQLGSVIRLHEDAPTSMEYASSLMGYQIDFKDSPDAKEIDRRIDKIKEYYDSEYVFNAAEYCIDCMGVADTFDAVAKLLLVITCVVVVLVTVLMERSFISDEEKQIALYKSIGFNNKFIIKWQIIRFMIVTVSSELIAVIFTYPVTKLWCDPIWKMMGASNVKYVFNPVSLIVIYPGIILAINLASVCLTALYTNRITSNAVRNIE